MDIIAPGKPINKKPIKEEYKMINSEKT